MAAIVYNVGDLVLVDGISYGDGLTGPCRWRVSCRVLAGPTAAGQYHVQPVRWDAGAACWLDRAEPFWVFGHLIVERMANTSASALIRG